MRRVRDGVPCREQHPDRRSRTGRARPRDALDSRRALLGGRLPRRAAEVPDGHVQSAGVQACSAKALVFGDPNDPESEVARLARSPRGSKLLEDLGTLPNVTYLERQTQV